MNELIDPLLSGASTAIPIVVSTVIILNRFRKEICKQITDLTIKIDTHIGIAEHDREEFINFKDKHLSRNKK